MWMRGGTSKGGYFLAADLPPNRPVRAMLSCCGSWVARPAPDRRHGRSRSADLQGRRCPQVRTSRRRCRLPVSAGLRRSANRHRWPELRQHPRRCRPLRHRTRPRRGRGTTARPVRIFMENTGQIAGRRSRRRAGKVTYAGDARIDGVPGTSAPLPIEFRRIRPDRPAARCCRPAMKSTRRRRGRDSDRQRHALRRSCRATEIGITGRRRPRNWKPTAN
jgi:4-oxalomesaconate tautomerase